MENIKNIDHPAIYISKNTFGNGLFTSKNISKDVYISGFYGELYRTQSEMSLPVEARFTAMPISPLLYVNGFPNSAGNNINHSCEANCYVKNLVEIHTLRSISAGEELTINYSLICNSDWHPPNNSNCLCGAASCAGTIRPYRDLSPEEKVKHLPYTSDWILFEEMKKHGFLTNLKEMLQKT